MPASFCIHLQLLLQSLNSLLQELLFLLHASIAIQLHAMHCSEVTVQTDELQLTPLTVMPLSWCFQLQTCTLRAGIHTQEDTSEHVET